MSNKLQFKQIYLDHIKSNMLAKDSSQEELVELLTNLQEKLEPKKSIFSKLLSKKLHFSGLYVYGDVGRGKSMVADLFYSNIHLRKKKKYHFYDFMSQVHQKLHNLSTENSSSHHIKQVAKQFQCDLLYLDELQINNIADAMIVYRLFEALISLKTFVIFTSNRQPEDLFKDGLQRERFLPFIDLINNKMHIHYLCSEKDYRMLRRNIMTTTYYYPLSIENKVKVNSLVEQITDNKFESRNILVNNSRYIEMDKCYGGLLVASFNDLCKRNFSSLDYMAICENFHTIILLDIPILTQDHYNEALRFITLIDCMYESKTKILCLAESKPENLYVKGKHKFEFARTISRLHEMTSE